jgi:hypothetical protein
MAEFEELHVSELKKLRERLAAEESMASKVCLRAEEVEEKEGDEEEEESGDSDSFHALGIRKPQRARSGRDEETLGRDDR